MTRPALVLSLTVLALLASAGGASACIVQGGGANPVGGEPSALVHPRDPMQFSISKLDEGASYSVTIGGRSIVRDAVKRAGSGFGPVTEPFPLPDYGPSPRSLVVSVHVFHARGGTGHEDSLADFLGAPALQYAPRAAAQPQPQPQSEGLVEPPAGAPSPAAAAPAPAPAATSPVARVRRTTH